jgi:hypothetical protein
MTLDVPRLVLVKPLRSDAEEYFKPATCTPYKPMFRLLKSRLNQELANEQHST